MNKKIEDLKNQTRNLKNEYLKVQNFDIAKILRHIEWVLGRIETPDDLKIILTKIEATETY